MARRCDDTVDKKRVNSSVLKHLFLGRVEQSKISPKTPGNALSDALLMSCFQMRSRFSGGRGCKHDSLVTAHLGRRGVYLPGTGTALLADPCYWYGCDVDVAAFRRRLRNSGPVHCKLSDSVRIQLRFLLHRRRHRDTAESEPVHGALGVL